MNEEKLNILLAKLMSNEITGEEEQLLNEWGLLSPDNYKILNQVKQLKNIKPSENFTPDLNAIWNNIETNTKNVQQPFVKQGLSKKIYLYSSSVAAAVIILVYLFLTDNNESYKSRLVENGTRADITLSDGTRIILDAGSKIEYPDEFNGEDRIVKFSGEGYFEVARDESKKFKVLMGSDTVEVLGTKFNIKSWDIDSTKEVAVFSGKVKVASPVNNQILLKNNFCTIAGNNKVSAVSDFDHNKILEWQNKEKHYSDTELRRILFDIERWYGLSSKIADEGLLSNKITFNMKRLQADELLKILSQLTNRNITRKGKVIIAEG